MAVRWVAVESKGWVAMHCSEIDRDINAGRGRGVGGGPTPLGGRSGGRES